MQAKEKKKLRQGFTTGTAAAAASKAALLHLLTREAPGFVEVDLLNGQSMQIPVDSVFVENGQAEAVIIKDAGDDPDITHKARIGAKVCLIKEPGEVKITGGQGVGVVTKPGLEIPPGEPAINLGPRQMIRQSAEQALAFCENALGVSVEIFVENGRELAKKTLNHRLGIEGGLSILGTTGLVKPLSHEAYIAAIESALSVAKACGSDHVVLTTGRRTEKHAQAFFKELPEEAFIQIGDFFQMSMQGVLKNQLAQTTLAVFFGKALKMAQGIPHTHASKSSLTMDWLAGHVRELTEDDALAGEVARANTARHAFGMVYPDHPKVLERVGEHMIKSASGFCDGKSRIRAIIFDFEGNMAFDSMEGSQTHE
ncbi:cobalt-precorrin-5B (C1)-methyltransferase [Desulfatibacillum alkenivorans DSM 16219]|uniref:Cobalt-precorrin-5B C(1)-methyltransferase n=1 Tax=Desulfatibacillum alkenivorans DSM 16219 TaxID=1121393 RepID=A0A1M6UAW4_9BACT|nr:cobalt-precorrin-5B (C(1))-methyltransferase CbiD [Desulfatibacillum alkenivorans]SHK66326.1 cobalt-precorrin-5B (C1)-methyltransferase [Desulfatibacillum alkenivorans DSM 16219]